MEIYPDSKYPKDVQYCRLKDVCIAICEWECLEKNNKNWNCTDIGVHIEQTLLQVGELVNAVYFFNAGGDTISEIIKLAEHLVVFQKDWLVEDVIPFRQCRSCKKICKMNIPMDNFIHIPDFSDYCMACL